MKSRASAEIPFEHSWGRWLRARKTHIVLSDAQRRRLLEKGVEGDVRGKPISLRWCSFWRGRRSPSRRPSRRISRRPRGGEYGALRARRARWWREPWRWAMSLLPQIGGDRARAQGNGHPRRNDFWRGPLPRSVAGAELGIGEYFAQVLPHSRVTRSRSFRSTATGWRRRGRRERCAGLLSALLIGAGTDVSCGIRGYHYPAKRSARCSGGPTAFHGDLSQEWRAESRVGDRL